MRRVKKPVFFIVSILIVVFTALTFVGIHTQYGDIKTTYIKGVDDIRWGIDIRGGVDVTFAPPDGVKATTEQVDSVKEVIQQRLVTLGITDNELYPDYKNGRIMVRFPWKEGEAGFDPEQAVKELGATALLTFREGKETDAAGMPSGVTKENIILEGADVESAKAMVDNNNEYIVSLTLSSEGAKKFSTATEKMYVNKDIISIWMDDTMISYPNVSAHITDGKAQISGGFTAEEVKKLADKINAGALPFKLVTKNFSTISPTLGAGARDAMALAGMISFVLVSIFMMVVYKVPGFVAVIGLLGQTAGSLAAVSGFIGFMPSFTLTIPGIAGIILSIGMGVDANVITAERIKEEIRGGKSLDGAVAAGYDRAFSAIFDGNITVVIVAVVLMGAFGPPESAFAKLLSPVLFMFAPTTTGAIYSFGYTLLIGVILNFLMGVLASRLMQTSISKFKFLRNPKLYGGESRV